MPYIPDNFSQFEAHERRKEQQLEELPECELCGEPIQQETAVRLCGTWFCDGCLEDNRVDTEMI